MSNLAIRNRLTVGNVWQGGAVALFDRDYAGVLLDLGNVIDSTFDQELEATDFRTARTTGTLITEARPIKRLELPITLKVNAPDPIPTCCSSPIARPTHSAPRTWPTPWPIATARPPT